MQYDWGCYSKEMTDIEIAHRYVIIIITLNRFITTAKQIEVLNHHRTPWLYRVKETVNYDFSLSEGAKKVQKMVWSNDFCSRKFREFLIF